MKVNRLDIGELRSPQTRPDGSLRVDAYLTRAGVFSYRQKNGSIRHELRSPEEVFKADSLKTLELVTFTNDHPSTGKVTLDSLKTFSVGTVGERIEKIDNKVKASIVVTDATAISDIRSGKTQTSAGYSCELDEKSGIWEGEHYDAIQKDIEYNHVALVHKGRAGPEVAVRADRLDAWQYDPTEPDMPMKKIKIDGKDFEVPAEVADALESAEKVRKDADDKAHADESAAVKALRLDAEKAKDDAAKAQAAADMAKAEAKKAREDAVKEVEQKIELIGRAAALGVEGVKPEMTARKIMESALAKVSPEFKLDGKPDAYVQAAFDIAYERRADNALGDAHRALRGDASENMVRLPRLDDAKRQMLQDAEANPAKGLDPALGIAAAAEETWKAAQRERWRNPKDSQK